MGGGGGRGVGTKYPEGVRDCEWGDAPNGGGGDGMRGEGGMEIAGGRNG